MTFLPAPGFWDRIRNRIILRSHPNYAKFKSYLRNVWNGK